MNPLMGKPIEELLDLLERSSVAYLTTGNEKHFNNVQEAKTEIIRRDRERMQK